MQTSDMLNFEGYKDKIKSVVIESYNEKKQKNIEEIENNTTVILGYPIQYSNAPYMVREFIKKNKVLWEKRGILSMGIMTVYHGGYQPENR